ncbi:enoyl-ACP reductase FabI [Aquihabitans daechungensis]|uniref:enoyl-ACP reductase FabI n=1 Tax=Aquihabitans daechungensis TaxID=1052257 RepID=UPI003BA17F9F
MLLADRTILVTGVLTPSSIAFTCARLAQEQGATVVLTSFGRARSLTERAARRLPAPAEVIELDVADPDHLRSLADRMRPHTDRVDGVVHAIGFAPANCLGQDDGLFSAEWEDVATALQVSAWSLPALAKAVRPLLPPGAAIVGLDFDASVAWPAYDWMGVAKAALESAARYLARDLGPAGIRVNLVAAGPLRTVAARSIPGFAEIEAVWAGRAPLGWDVDDPEPAARAVVSLLSDWFPATTGEIVHVDGGVHAIGAALQPGRDDPAG